MWSLLLFPSRSLSQTATKAPLLFRSSTRLFSSVNTAVGRGWKASASLLVLPTSAAVTSRYSAMVSVLHPVWDPTAATATITISTASSSSSSSLDRQVRYFGAPKRYKGKGPYIRKKPKGPKRAPRRERAFPPPPPIINAVPREIRRAEIDQKDQQFADQLKMKISQQHSVLRFDMTSMPMSDRLKRLLELTNGSQREVIKAQKERGIQLFQKREGDTGSSAVQIVALTTRIQQLQTHMATHRKDHSTKRRLDALYVRRRKLLDYLERKDFESFRNVSKTLGLAR
jgi:small subunit ribosomal protein S15